MDILKLLDEIRNTSECIVYSPCGLPVLSNGVSSVSYTHLDVYKRQQYYSINVPMISGLDEETTYLKNGEVNHIVLNYEKIRDNQVFKLEELEINQYSKQHLFVKDVYKRQLQIFLVLLLV